MYGWRKLVFFLFLAVLAEFSNKAEAQDLQEKTDPAKDSLERYLSEIMSLETEAKQINDDGKAENTETAAKRKKPSHDNDSGITSGAFTYVPSFVVESVATDNVGESAGNRQADIGVKLAPELYLKGDFGRSSLSFKASGEDIRYVSQSRQNSSDGKLEGTLGFRLRGSTFADLSLSATKSQSSAGANDVPDTAIGKRDDYIYSASGKLEHMFAMLDLATTSLISRHAYSNLRLNNGSLEDNGDRNYTEFDHSVEIRYTPEAIVNPLIEFAFIARDHDEGSDRFGFNRDSTGFRLRAGAKFEWSDLLSGRAGLQYDRRFYQDIALADFGGAGIFADMKWRPTQFTTFSIVAASDVEESADDGVSGARVHTVDLSAEHDLSQDLTAKAEAGFEYTQSMGSGDRTLDWSGKLGITRHLTPALALVVDYEFKRQVTNGADTDFLENRIMAGVKLAP